MIHETAALSILEAVPRSPVCCELGWDDEVVDVAIRSIAAKDRELSAHRSSWTALRGLIPSVRMTQYPYEDILGGYRTELEFTWRQQDPG